MNRPDFRKILEDNSVQILKADSTTNIYYECPFCNKGKRASYSIEKDIYTCWSCKADGEKRATGKATNMLYHLSGKILKSSNSNFKSDNEDFKKEVYAALGKVIDFHKKHLRENKEEDLTQIVKEIEKIDDDRVFKISEEYNLGVAPSDPYLTARTLLAKGVSRRALLNTGLFVVEKGEIIEILSGWLTMPVENPSGITSSQIGINLFNENKAKSRRAKGCIIYRDNKENMDLRLGKVKKLREDIKGG